MKNRKAITLLESLFLMAIFIGLTVAFTYPLYNIQQDEKDNDKHLNITFEHNGYKVMVVQSPSPPSQPRIQISEPNSPDKFIFAETNPHPDTSTPWTEDFILIDWSHCDPNSPLYEYTRETFNEIRSLAYKIKAERVLDNRPIDEAKMLEAPQADSK